MLFLLYFFEFLLFRAMKKITILTLFLLLLSFCNLWGRNPQKLFTWGRYMDGQSGNRLIPEHLPAQPLEEGNWRSVEAGNGYVAALKSDGTLWALG